MKTTLGPWLLVAWSLAAWLCGPNTMQSNIIGSVKRYPSLPRWSLWSRLTLHTSSVTYSPKGWHMLPLSIYDVYWWAGNHHKPREGLLRGSDQNLVPFGLVMLLVSCFHSFFLHFAFWPLSSSSPLHSFSQIFASVLTPRFLHSCHLSLIFLRLIRFLHFIFDFAWALL